MTEVTFDYVPIPIFVPFHMERTREVALAGGYGSGKSWALCADAIGFGLRNPGVEVVICRKHVPSLRDTTEQIFVSLLPDLFFKACDVSRLGGHYAEIQFPNGSKFMFKGMDDWTKHKSLSLAGIYYDEADEIDEDTYVGMMSRLRQRQPTAAARRMGAAQITERRIRLAFNPAGHNWIWKRFIGPDRTAGTAWFKSTSLDNPHLPLEYLQSLLDMPKPWVKRYVLCDFDDFGGQIYQDWGWDTHVIEPYRGLDGMPDYADGGHFLMGMDPGTRDPTAAVWAYYDPQRHSLVGVAEYQEDSLAAVRHAAAWRQIEARYRMKVRRRIADPHAINVRDRGTNNALSDQYRRLGYNFELGPTKERDRITSLGQLIAQGRFLVTTDCPMTYERIKEYQWKDLTPTQRAAGEDAPDKPLKKNTHLVECTQFMASRWVAPPKLRVPADPAKAQAAEVARAIKRQLAAGRTAKVDHDLGSVSV